MNTIVTTCKFDGSGFPYSEEYKTIQEWARNSWAKLEMRVITFNKVGQVYSKDLAKELMKYDVAAQVNCDCILLPGVEKVFDKLRAINSPAWATSYRRSFELSDYPNLSKGQIINPLGLDIFIGNKMFWENWYKTVDPRLSRLGLVEDNILCSFGNEHYPKNSYDFTKLKCVYHPNHSDASRIQGRHFNLGIPGKIDHCNIPANKI